MVYVKIESMILNIKSLKCFIVLTVAGIFLFSQCACAEIELLINEENKHKLEMSNPVEEINDNLFESEKDMLKYYLENQKKMDVEDIKLLWEATVERNPIILFALKKLTLPPEKRRINSSRMTKVISTLIRGAAMLPGLMGADSMTSSATALGGSLAERAVFNKTMPKEMPMTDTELIQLAKLVEDLQDKVIRNYYSYKSNLNSYKRARGNAVKFGALYSDALESSDLPQMLTYNTLHNKSLKGEAEFKQKVKLNRLNLERLAGIEAVGNLNLGKAYKPPRSVENTIPKRDKTGVMQGKIDYYDKDINYLAEEIGFELSEEREELLSDLQVLWRAAVERNETIRFAIIKLSNPEGVVQKKTAVKKILSPLASVAPVIGLGLGDPVSAGSAIFGGNLLNSVLSDDSKINNALTRVTDADLVLLAQETDALQEKLVSLYYSYLSTLIELEYANNTENDSRDYLHVIRKENPELYSIADVFYNEALDLKYRTRQEVLQKRVELEQFVGNEALLLIDKSIRDRLSYTALPK